MSSKNSAEAAWERGSAEFRFAETLRFVLRESRRLRRTRSLRYLAGEAIEEYPHVKPYPSALIFGTTRANRPLHIVCAYDDLEDRAVIVTVYQPQPDRWVEYRRRKK